MSAPRSRSRLLPVLLTAVLTLGVLVPAHADDPQELRRQLAEQQRRSAELEERTADAEAELAAVRERLDALEDKLTAASERLSAAQEEERRATEEAEVARTRVEHALRELAAAEEEVEANDAQLGGMARDTYKYGAPRTSVVSLVGSVTLDEHPSSYADALAYLERGIGRWSELVESANALVVKVDAAAVRAEEERELREAALAQAAAARDEAAGIHAEIEELVTQASMDQLRQEELITELEARRAEATARIGDLEQRIEAEEQRRREAEARRKAEEERRRREAAERERAAAQRTSSSSSSSSGGSGGGSTSIRPAGGGLVTVGGITVAASLGPSLQALLDAARADGIVLGGHGWRSPEVTARLRISNGCPDVYDSPASSCRVPTARPGTSEHEKGLAVDFTYQGRTICYPSPGSRCHGNAAFDWLKANAGKYGLRNLPSEAWHWSTTGR